MDKIRKFEELGEKRMVEAIKKIRLIGNLSNKNNYEYSEEHVKAIVNKLEKEIELLKNKFSKEIEPSIEFRFKSKK